MFSAELTELIARLEELPNPKFIRPSFSRWKAPIRLVSKMNGALRICVDYRASNRVTVKSHYPLMRIDDTLDQWSKPKYFSKIVRWSKYHHVLLYDDSIPMTAFCTRYGFFQFFESPFGLTDAPVCITSLRNKTFKSDLCQFVKFYFDDILVYSQTLEEHHRHLRTILERFSAKKLNTKLS